MHRTKARATKNSVKRIGMKRYRKEFGVDGAIAGDREKTAETLKHALDIRKFEIQLYWARATYFWAFIAAAYRAGAVLLQ